MKHATIETSQEGTIRERELFVEHGNFLHSQAIFMTVEKSWKFSITALDKIVKWFKNSEIPSPGQVKSKGAKA